METATAVSMPRVSIPTTASKRRKRNSRRRRWHLPTLAISKVLFSARWLSLGLLAICVYAMVLTGLSLDFYLTAIPVHGASSLPTSEIVTASGLAGSHIFAADPNVAAEQIAQVPGVISATVTIGWPNEVLVNIKEDSPVAIWRDGGQDFWITADGRLLPSRDQKSEGIPLIISEVAFEAAVVVTDDENEDEVETERVLNIPIASVDFIPMDVLLGALQMWKIRPSLTELYYRPSSGLSFDEADGWRVHVGTGTDMHQKLVVYEAIVAELQTRELTPEYISVSNQEKPYFMAK